MAPHSTNNSKPKRRHWVTVVLFATGGVAALFAANLLSPLAYSLQQQANPDQVGPIVPNFYEIQPEIQVVVLTLCLFGLIYGFMRIFYSHSLKSVEPLIGVGVLVTAMTAAILFAPYSAPENYVFKMNLVLFLVLLLLSLSPLLIYIAFIYTKKTPLWDDFENNLKKIYFEEDPKDRKETEELYRLKFTNMFGAIQKSPKTDPVPADKLSWIPSQEAMLPVMVSTALFALGWLYISTRIQWILGRWVQSASESLSQGVETVAQSLATIMQTLMSALDTIEGPVGEPVLESVSGVGIYPGPMEIDPIIFGFLGAYLYSISLLFRRYAQSDLNPIAYANVNTRIITRLWQ